MTSTLLWGLRTPGALRPRRGRRAGTATSLVEGYDAHKHVEGRKRHLLVDTLGMLLAKRLKVRGYSLLGFIVLRFFGEWSTLEHRCR
jgi:hypothetical protein